MPVVNMEGVPVGFQPVPDLEEAEVTFTSFKNGEQKADGSVSIGLELTIKTPADHAGRKVFLNHNTGPKGLPHLKESMYFLGASEAEVESRALDTDEVLKGLYGAESVVQIGHRKGPDGKIWNSVTFIADKTWE